MCQINIEQRESFRVLSKTKQNGSIESMTISNWAIPAVRQAIAEVICNDSNVIINIKTKGYRIFTGKSKKYLSIRNMKRKYTIFIPRKEIYNFFDNFKETIEQC